MVYFDSPCDHMQPLRYSSASGDSTSPILLLALGVAAYVLITSMDRRAPMACMPRPGAVASMLSSVSARIVGKTTAKDLADGGEAVELIDGGDTDSSKAKNEKKVRDFLKKDGKGCIMIFAHWCPHCKEMMKEMVKVANENAGSGVEFLMVNAEAVASGVWTGDDAVHELKFYPTVLCKMDKKVEQVASPEEAVATAKEAVAEEAPKAEEAEEAEEPADTDEMLNMLF